MSQLKLASTSSRRPSTNGGSKSNIAETTENTSNGDSPVITEVSSDAPLDPEQERDKRIRAGIMPIFLTSVTKGMFKVNPENFPAAEEGVENPMCFKMIPKADLLADIQARLVMSDFHPAKAVITVCRIFLFNSRIFLAKS
jgi:hypothetical protein